MDHTKLRLDVSTDTGVALTATAYRSSPVTGWLQSIDWYPASQNDTGGGDTGADLQVYQDFDPNDTGNSLLIASYKDLMSLPFVKFPRVAVQDPAGDNATFGPDATGNTDTGATLVTPVLFVGDQLRIVVTPGYADSSGPFTARFSREK